MKTKTTITKQMIENVLDNYPDTRNSDLALGNKICTVYNIYLLMIDWMTEANFISRTRRRFQQMWLYLPTDKKVQQRRGQLREAMREEYTPSKKQIQEYSLQEVMAW